MASFAPPKPSDRETLHRQRVKNAAISGDLEPGIELNETLQPENTIIDLGNAERAKNVIELQALGWKPGSEWAEKVSEILKSPLSKLEDRQVNEGSVAKEEAQMLPERGSMEFSVNSGRIENDINTQEYVSKTSLEVQPEDVFDLQSLGRKMEVEDIGQSPFDIDRSVSFTEDFRSAINFKLLFSWIGSGLFSAAKFAKEITTETTKGVKGEVMFKVPKQEDSEKVKEKQVKAKKKGNQQSFLNSLVTLVANPDSKRAVEAKREYVNKKVGFNAGYEESVDISGQARADIEVILERVESEEAENQKKAVEQAQAQSIQGPQINIDAAVEGGTGKGGVANISSQAAG